MEEPLLTKVKNTFAQILVGLKTNKKGVFYGLNRAFFAHVLVVFIPEGKSAEISIENLILRVEVKWCRGEKQTDFPHNLLDPIGALYVMMHRYGSTTNKL